MNAEVYASPDGWRFRVKGGNGEIIATGEAYVRRVDAEHVLKVLFSSPINVAVRNHANEVDKNYTLGPVHVVTAGSQDLPPTEPGLPFDEDREALPEV